MSLQNFLNKEYLGITEKIKSSNQKAEEREFYGKGTTTNSGLAKVAVNCYADSFVVKRSFHQSRIKILSSIIRLIKKVYKIKSLTIYL